MGAARPARGQRGRPGCPKPRKSTENDEKSTSNCKTCTHMGPNHLKIMFCTSMHYFEVVLCTLLVPSKNSRGIFIEISWKSLGSNLSGPLAGPLEKQSKSKKNQRKINGPRAVQKVQNLPGHWKSSKKSINSIKCLWDFFIFFIKPSEAFSFSYKIFQILAPGLLGSGSAGSGPAGPAWMSKTSKKHRK